MDIKLISKWLVGVGLVALAGCASTQKAADEGAKAEAAVEAAAAEGAAAVEGAAAETEAAVEEAAAEGEAAVDETVDAVEGGGE